MVNFTCSRSFSTSLKINSKREALIFNHLPSLLENYTGTKERFLNKFALPQLDTLIGLQHSGRRDLFSNYFYSDKNTIT